MDKALFGLIGVVLGAILTVARELWIDHRSRKKRAEYLAIRISCILDRFTDGCVAVVQDDGLFQGQRDEQGCCQVQAPAPNLDLQSIDVDWQSLTSDLMYEILNFPTDVEGANQSISSTFEYVACPPDYDEGFEERQYQYSKLGLRSADLSERLRAKYNLPSKNYASWNPLDYLEKQRAEIEQLRAKREQAHKHN